MDSLSGGNENTNTLDEPVTATLVQTPASLGFKLTSTLEQRSQDDLCEAQVRSEPKDEE